MCRESTRLIDIASAYANLRPGNSVRRTALPLFQTTQDFRPGHLSCEPQEGFASSNPVWISIVRRANNESRDWN